MQHEILQTTPLHNAKGRLIEPGWARKMLYTYERDKLRGPIKEWDFYQMLEGDMLLQMTIGHLSYIASFSATLLNLATGERRVFSRMRPLPLRSLNMPQDPSAPHELCVSGRDYVMRFTASEQLRELRLDAPDAEIDVAFETDPENDKLVIATPFDRPRQFYCNYKENYYSARGRAVIGDMAHSFINAVGLLDWGRGLWPYLHEWYWGNGAGTIDGHSFGFNIGWGFGNTVNATENVYFIDGRAHKLDGLSVESDEAADRMRPWRFDDPEGRLSLTMTPRFDNFTETNLGLVHTRCHQIFGRFSGYALMDGGERLEIDKLPAFCEHAVNRW